MHCEDCDVMLLVETHSVSEGLVASIFRVLVYPEWMTAKFSKKMLVPLSAKLLSAIKYCT